MANAKIFKNQSQNRTTTQNEAGGTAYNLSDKAALAQLVCTGTFNDTFYKSGEQQTQQIINLLRKVAETEPTFITKLAVYARQAGMKDTPVFIWAWMVKNCGKRGKELGALSFMHVIDNGRQLRTLVQMCRSGIFGSKSMGSYIKKAVQLWLLTKPISYIINASVGNSPALGDILRMVHPKPNSKEREQVFNWLLHGFQHTTSQYPEVLRQLKAFREGRSLEAPNLDFRLLTSTDLSIDQWKSVAESMNWTALRMNLNSLASHGVLHDKDVAERVAAKLVDGNAIVKAKASPYQLMVTYQATQQNPVIPNVIKNALHSALDLAIDNIPTLNGNVVTFIDISGSMQSPVTGDRGKGATTVARCVDVAALIGASILRHNKNATILPFDTVVENRRIMEPQDSVLTNASKMASSLRNQGTNISSTLEYLIKNRLKPDFIFWVTDEQTWCDIANYYDRNPGAYKNSNVTRMEELWRKYQQFNPTAKAIHVNLSVGTTTQMYDENRKVLNIGGWSDSIWPTIAEFTNGRVPGKVDWVTSIERTQLGE